MSKAERAGSELLCSRVETDCLAFVRAHQAEYPAVAADMRQREAALDNLLQYDYFRPRHEQYDFNAEMPSFQILLRARNLHAYRFVSGEVEAAQRGLCRDLVLGRRLIHSRGSLLGSVIAARLIERDVTLLAQMHAELPPEAPWPALCDELQTLPPQELALCPLMYGEWLGFQQSMTADNVKAMAAADGADEALYLILEQQKVAQDLHEKAKYCAPPILAAIEQDELRLPQRDRWPRYCSLLNPLCRLSEPDKHDYQATLLNTNHYLRALAILRDPAAPLPQGYRLENGQLHFCRHPERKEEGMQAIALPLPGSHQHGCQPKQTEHTLPISALTLRVYRLAIISLLGTAHPPEAFMTAHSPKILLVHGLFMRATMMMPLATRLRRQGFVCLALTYPTRQQTLHDSVAQHLPRIQDFAADAPLYAVGHSLGGLYLRHLLAAWPEGLAHSRVVTLGTPHLGSKVGAYFRERGWRRSIIGHCWEAGLDGSAPPWDPAIPLLSIAGTKSFGIGSTLRLFAADEPNDGTVAVAETELPEAAAYHRLPTTHTALQFDSDAAQLVNAWFRNVSLPRTTLAVTEK